MVERKGDFLLTGVRFAGDSWKKVDDKETLAIVKQPPRGSVEYSATSVFGTHFAGSYGYGHPEVKPGVEQDLTTTR
jgi:hypothetical protein